MISKWLFIVGIFFLSFLRNRDTLYEAVAVSAERAALGRNPTLPPGGSPGAWVLVSRASALPVSPVLEGGGAGQLPCL